MQQLMNDAKRLVTRLREHDNTADGLISQAQAINNHMETMKQYHQEVETLNSLAYARPRSALILNIQQENRHIRELQQENRELRAMLEEHQSALELVMNKYRQQVSRISQTVKAEQAWVKRDYSQELKKRSEKISEMASVMKKAIEVDDENYAREQENLKNLAYENQLMRDILEINDECGRSIAARKAAMHRTDECVQTDL